MRLRSDIGKVRGPRWIWNGFTKTYTANHRRPIQKKQKREPKRKWYFNKGYTILFDGFDTHYFYLATGDTMTSAEYLRYEDKCERFDRIYDRWTPQLVEVFGTKAAHPKLMSIFDMMPDTNLVTSFISMFSVSEILATYGEAEPERRTALALEMFKKKFPEAKASPLVDIHTVLVNGEDAIVNNTVHTSPIVIEGVGTNGPMVLIKGETPFGNSDACIDAYLIFNKGDYRAVLTFIDAIVEIEKEISHIIREIKVWGSGPAIPLPEQTWNTWEEVFLNEEVMKQVRDDLLFFVKNEDVFRKVGIPYKRGYLLCGPPGNGKTTICRTIATSMPFAAYSFDFSNQDMGNGDLTEAFRAAADNAPSVFFLEDIDRIYSPDEKNRANVTLDHLLNCLDGIATNNGVVVVATANHPENLDPAILSRPGRFDRVVKVEDPDHALRLRYLNYLFRHTTVGEEAIEWAADETEGLSMAYLKEVFVLSASRSAIYGEAVTLKHIKEALDSILQQFNGVSKSGRRKSGFGND